MYTKQISMREYWKNKRATIISAIHDRDEIRIHNILEAVSSEEFKNSINDSMFHYSTREDYQNKANPLTPAQTARGILISLGIVPQSLQNYGLPKCELVISLHAIGKALGQPESADAAGRDGTDEFHSHSVKKEDIENLTALIARPLAILPNPAATENEKSYLLILDAVDENGNQLVAPVRLPQGNFEQAFIPTIYGETAKKLLNMKDEQGSVYWSEDIQLTNNIENLVYNEAIKTHSFDSISSENFDLRQELFDEEHLRVDLENSTLLIDLFAKYKLESRELFDDTGLFVVRPLNSQTPFPYGIITWKFSNLTDSQGAPIKNSRGKLIIWFCAKRKSEGAIWQQARNMFSSPQ